MGVSLAQSAHTDKVGNESAGVGPKNQGILKTEGGKEHLFIAFEDTESATKAVCEFLQEANFQKKSPDALVEFIFVHITPELVDTENEIANLLQHLAPESDQTQNTGHKTQTKPLPQTRTNPQDTPSRPHSTASNQSRNGEVVYSSLFTLARSFQTNLSNKRNHPKSDTPKQERGVGREETRSSLLSLTASPFERLAQGQTRHEREGGGNKQGRDQEENDRQKEQKEKKEKKHLISAIKGKQAARSDHPSLPQTTRSNANVGTNGNASPYQVVGSVENIYIRFMALMARILGQAELEAHELYLRIKERTDNVDILTLLLSKINSEKGDIDWSNNEEMKQLIEKARAIGVDIPKDKLTWSEEEKKLFKENIQMRKDSLEKVTQLERTDMQRFLQEASQCHQARSNILKLLKEVTDTILANIRP